MAREADDEVATRAGNGERESVEDAEGDPACFVNLGITFLTSEFWASRFVTQGSSQIVYRPWNSFKKWSHFGR